MKIHATGPLLATFLLTPLAAAAGGGGEENLFTGNLGNAVLTAIIFAIVVYVLGTKAWPVLIKALDERERSIRGALESAKHERQEAAKLLKDYQAQLDKARVEATAIVDEGRRDAEEVRRRIQDQARRESDEMIARARREIQLATDAAVKELHDQTVELSIQVARGIIAKEMQADDHRRLVSESLERMKAEQN